MAILLKLLSFLPLGLLRVLAKAICLLVFNIFGYRKRVVLENISNSFPEKTLSEYQKIHQRYIAHFATIMAETIKQPRWDQDTINRKVTFENLELINQLEKEGHSLALIGGHMGNWELVGLAMSLQIEAQLLTIYRPLKNAAMDKVTRESRSRFGAELIPMKGIARRVSKASSEVTATIFINDQWPVPEQAYWVPFLNRETAFHAGMEKIIKRYKLTPIYTTIRALENGEYAVRFEKIEVPVADGQLTANFAQLMQRDIEQQPHNWLWSHRRWKHPKSRYFPE